MLALFVRTNCVSWRKQTWIVRLLCLSRSRNVIPLRLRLRFTGQLRQLFMFLVRLRSCRLSKGKGWPSRCSPGLKRLRVGPTTRGQQEVPLSTGSHRREGSQRSLRTLKSTRRRPLLPTGHQSLAAATGPGLSSRFAHFEEGGLSKKTGRLPRDFLASCLGFRGLNKSPTQESRPMEITDSFLTLLQNFAPFSRLRPIRHSWSSSRAGLSPSGTAT